MDRVNVAAWAPSHTTPEELPRVIAIWDALVEDPTLMESARRYARSRTWTAWLAEDVGWDTATTTTRRLAVAIVRDPDAWGDIISMMYGFARNVHREEIYRLKKVVRNPPRGESNKDLDIASPAPDPETRVLERIALRDTTDGLSASERDLLGMIAEGLAAREIADELGITTTAVDKRKSRLIRKLKQELAG